MKKQLISIFMFGLLVFIFMASSGNFCYARTLHMIIVAQNNDQHAYFSKDYVIMQRLAEDVSVVTGMTLEKHYFEKSNLNEDRLRTEIGNLRCGSDDVIWFYYSGHGKNGDGRWPCFNIQDNSDIVPVVQKELHEQLKKKGARLTITMYETCNHGYTLPNNRNLVEYFQYLPAYPFSISENLQYVCKKLFLDAYGDVMMCAAKQGSYNWQNEIGGVFTNSFVVNLNRLQEEQEISWQILFNKTKQMTQMTGDKNQTPDAEINIWKVEKEPEEPKPKRVIKFD